MRPYIAQIGAGVGLLAGAALLARIGQMIYIVGLSRAKNSAGTTLRCLCDFCTAGLVFWAVGAAVLFQHDNGVFGVDWRLIFGFAITRPGTIDAGGILLTAIVVSIATGAVVGAAAGRSKFFPLVAASVLLAALVVPIGGHWALFGWLARLGFVDLGGASWAHLSGGICALVTAWAVGARQGKYHRDGAASLIPGHSLPLAGVGAFFMLAGWAPYVAAMAALGAKHDGGIERTGLNVFLSAAAAGWAAIIFSQLRYGKPDVGHTLTGMLGGIVAISASGGMVASFWAVTIGAVAGFLVPMASVWIDLVIRIDDPVGAIAIHAAGGLWGTLAVGLFMPGTFAERARNVGVQLLGAAAVGVLSATASLALFLPLRAIVGLRTSELDEFDGLDLAQHDIAAYPDFQQNTIRSYHMREA